jgi:Flp pilus assembly pilin Flp
MAVIGKTSPRRRSGLLRRIRVATRKLLRDQRGTTSLEWALLLGAIALPAVYLLTMCLSVIIDYYRMMTMIGSLPCP